MQRIKFNTKNILDIISLEEFTTNVKNVTSKLDQNNLPFQMNDSFPKNFFANTKFLYRESNNSIELGFKISIYKKMTLFHLYVKPVLFNNKPFIYNTDSEYIAKSH